MFSQIKTIDQKTVFSLNNFFQKHSNNFWNKFFGEYLIYGLPIFLIILFLNKKQQKNALRALFAVILAWPVLSYFIGQWSNRHRPFELSGVKELLFHRPDYSFPSDHAAAVFAVAASLWFSGEKKLAGAVFAAGIIISFFRVGLGLHFPTDILGGLIIGILAAWLINLFDKPLDIIYNFILKIARVLRIA